MTRRLQLGWVLCVWMTSGCGQSEPADLREWQASDHVQPVAADPARTPTEAANEASDPARSVRALWNVACAACHGADGRGGGSSLPPGANVPDLTSAQWQSSRTDDEIASVIRDGKNMMPPFGKQVRPEGIAALVAHVRTLRAP